MSLGFIKPSLGRCLGLGVCVCASRHRLPSLWILCLDLCACVCMACTCMVVCMLVDVPVMRSLTCGPALSASAALSVSAAVPRIRAVPGPVRVCVSLHVYGCVYKLVDVPVWRSSTVLPALCVSVPVPRIRAGPVRVCMACRSIAVCVRWWTCAPVWRSSTGLSESAPG
jgi:hypothetical protein